MVIVNGKNLADEILGNVKKGVDTVKAQGEQINFTAVIVGDNPASVIYVNKKQKACESVGINMQTVRLDGGISQNELENTLSALSADSNVHAILLQLPLPVNLNSRKAISCIAPAKDVDGLTTDNFGSLAVEDMQLAPCTAMGIMHILKSSGINVAGKDVCVIGRSSIVGKPAALMLAAADATVTICHSKTKDLTKHTKHADIVIVAAGCPNLLRADMVRDGVAVIDVGVNRLDNGKICGDVDFENVSKKASLITPVPNGVGPLTIAFLLSNILQAFTRKK